MSPNPVPLHVIVATLTVLAVRTRLSLENWAAICREQGPVGGGHFYLGQRVRTTVDRIRFGPDDHPMPTGTLGVIAHMPSKWDPDYGVIIDGHPYRGRHAFGENELTAE